jgi:hypothetical protein
VTKSLGRFPKPFSAGFVVHPSHARGKARRWQPSGLYIPIPVISHIAELLILDLRCLEDGKASSSGTFDSARLGDELATSSQAQPPAGDRSRRTDGGCLAAAERLKTALEIWGRSPAGIARARAMSAPVCRSLGIARDTTLAARWLAFPPKPPMRSAPQSCCTLFEAKASNGIIRAPLNSTVLLPKQATGHRIC